MQDGAIRAGADDGCVADAFAAVLQELPDDEAVDVAFGDAGLNCAHHGALRDALVLGLGGGVVAPAIYDTDLAVIKVKASGGMVQSPWSRPPRRIISVKTSGRIR